MDDIQQGSVALDQLAAMGAALPADPAALNVPEAPPPGPTHLTYVPGPEDPSQVVWNNHRFRANVPLLVMNPQMIELAKGNPHFEVEGHVKAPIERRAITPTTSEKYRAHAVKWFREAKTATEFQERWVAEASMREQAGVGDDDVTWLSSIGDPILAELMKADDAEGTHE